MIGTGRACSIDAGPANSFKKDVRSRLGDMHLDLLVITHVDADHIDGAIQLLLDKEATFDDVWFNGWKHLPPSRGGREGAMLDALLTGKPWNLAFDGGVIQVPDQGPLPSVMVAGGARVTLLSPVPDGLQRLRRTWQKALGEVSVQPGSATEALELLARTDRFDEVVRGGNGDTKRTLGKDQSVPNGSSIAFLFEFGRSTCLFGGDAYAGVLASSLRRLAARTRRAQDQARPVQARPSRQPGQHHCGGSRVDRMRPIPRVDGRLEVQPPRRRRDPAHQQERRRGEDLRELPADRIARRPRATRRPPGHHRDHGVIPSSMTGHPRFACALGEEVGRARVRLAAVRPHDERIDRAATCELLGAVEDRLVALGVPIVVVAEVLDVHRAVCGRDCEHMVVALRPIAAQILDGAGAELLDAEWQRNVDRDAGRDRLLQNDEVGAGGSSRYDAARAEISEHLRNAPADERHERGGEAGCPPARKIDSIAGVDQEHSP